MCGVQFWAFTVLIVCLWSLNVHAAPTEEELNNMMEANMPHIEACAKEFDMTVDAVKELEPTSEPFSCFFACFLKKIEAFNEEGMFVTEKLTQYLRKFIKGEDTLSKLDNVIDDCSKVNDLEVSDGSEGCERAKVMFECWHEHEEELM